MFDMARAIHDGDFIYIRNFMPHLPALQGGKISGNEKTSIAELRRAKDAGELDLYSAVIFNETRPVEEFYDLKNDPYEIDNRIHDPKYLHKIQDMREKLLAWMIEYPDTGLLTESEYTRRAKAAGVSVHEMIQNKDYFDTEIVLQAALGNPVDIAQDEAAILYWKILQKDPSETSREGLKRNVAHDNPSVAVAAAELACRSGLAKIGLPVLLDAIQSDDLRLVMEASRALYMVGDAATPGVKVMEEVRQSLIHPERKDVYRDFNYPSFAGWALEHALINCGAAVDSDFPPIGGYKK